MSNNIFSDLPTEQRSTIDEQDYAPTWKPHENDEKREELVGIVVELHSEPASWSAGTQRRTIYTILSLGDERGSDFKEGSCWSPPLHSDLVNSRLQSANIGDLVGITYVGENKTNNGHTKYEYSVRVASKRSWSESQHANEIQELIETHRNQGGYWGDNRATGTPVVNKASKDGFRSAKEAHKNVDTSDEPEDAAGQSDNDGQSVADWIEEYRDGSQLQDEVEKQTDDILVGACYIYDLVELNGGEVPLETAETLFHEVREFDCLLTDCVKIAQLEIREEQRIIQQ